MIKIFLIMYLFTYSLYSESMAVKGVICEYSDTTSYRKYVAYLFKEKAEHYAFNQKREKIYLHKYFGYDYKSDDEFIVLGKNFFKINIKTRHLFSQENKFLGFCNFYSSIKKLFDNLEVYKYEEQKKLNN